MPPADANSLQQDDRDLVGLAVLCLLLAGPKHAYEMHRMIVAAHKEFVTGLPRSLYHAVARLERDGHVVAVETVRDGRSPERTVLAVSDSGREVVQARLERLLGVPDANSTLFTAALSFLSCLPPARARLALQARCDVLERRIAELDGGLAQVRERLPRILLVEDEHERVATTTQLAWVRALLTDLASGELTWPDDVADLAAAAEGGALG